MKTSGKCALHGIGAFEPLTTLSLEGADHPKNQEKNILDIVY
jgi:hypothetical protein